MLRGILAASAVGALVAAQMPAQADTVNEATSDSAERVIVIDAPDVQKLNTKTVPGFRTSEVIGTDVYSNAGQRIGEVEDFVMSGNGYFYAVVDVQDDGIERLVDVTDDEVVVIPWNQLRVSTRDQQAGR